MWLLKGHGPSRTAGQTSNEGEQEGLQEGWREEMTQRSLHVPHPAPSVRMLGFIQLLLSFINLLLLTHCQI